MIVYKKEVSQLLIIHSEKHIGQVQCTPIPLLIQATLNEKLNHIPSSTISMSMHTLHTSTYCGDYAYHIQDVQGLHTIFF